ncbi:hypothetical protein VTK73DRAFT_7639 [Phialemonium thermophilum]|uniref:Uncharacterized protein n=1 Tax=Phialemonium thermophilum TaxID=223376 RepID=A0ABR3Y6E1_9PEZI
MASRPNPEFVGRVYPSHHATGSAQQGTASNAAAIPKNNPSFGVLATVDTDADSASGVYRDGRVRNPVPSKLKGKTDERKGNFSVLHMDLGGKNEASERGAQAKRTSESTELAAKKALRNGYAPHRRSRGHHGIANDVGKSSVTPAPAVTPTEQLLSSTLGPSISLPLPSSSSRPTRTQPLDPVETKAEQARLLTLLRSLHPAAIVDQICKALAYFGGIPGAPPPADGAFPPSAQANGTGAYFVGWISEIFPKLSPEEAPSLGPNPEIQAPDTSKRKRGRPKGSKAKKVRKDKGVKKGPVKARKAGSNSSQPAQSSAADGSWVDVLDDDGGDENTATVEQRQIGLDFDQQARDDHLMTPIQALGNGRAALKPSSATPGTGVSRGVEPPSTGKRRGRPKGSKNRPKDSNSAANTTTVHQVPEASQEKASEHPYSQTTVPAVKDAPAPSAFTNQSFTPVNQSSVPAVESLSTTPSRKRTGRPKGSKNKPRSSDTTAGLSSMTTSPAINEVSINSQVPQSHSMTVREDILESAPPAPLGPHQTAAPNKRKRKAAQVADRTEARKPHFTAPSLGFPGLNSSHTQPAQTLPKTSVVPPPAKRQRKTKEKKTAIPVEGPQPSGDSASSPGLLASPVHQALQQPSNHDSLAVSVDHNMPSPQHGHFDASSPTIENYEAQLQAQLEQQAEPGAHLALPSGHVDARQLMSNGLSQQSQQQHRQPFQQRQQQQFQHNHLQQQQQQQQQHQVRAHQAQTTKQSLGHTSQSRSPIPQQQGSKSQTSSPMVSQHTTRAAQVNFQQYRQSNSPYTRPQAFSPQQHQQQQQQHQQQGFTAQQNSPLIPTQTTQSSQYSTTSQAQQQQQSQHPFASGQQHYSASQAQFGNGQQQGGSQPRFAQLGASSAGSQSFTSQPSPQFPAAASNSPFGTSDNAYRAPTGGLRTSSFPAQRSQAVNSNAANGYRHHHSPSFGTTTATAVTTSQQQQQQRQPSQHAVVQTTQGMQGLQSSFSGTTDWIFDTPSIDGSSGHNGIGLNNGSYDMGSNTVVARAAASNNTGSSFTQSAMATFDPSGLNGSDRYYHRR